MSNWNKLGLIFLGKGEYDWNKTHAQTPVADCEHKEFLRIYYAARDSFGRSNTSYIDVDKQNPKKVIYVHDKPLFNLGEKGTFDDNGIMPTCLVNHLSKKYLYYIGWTLKKNVPFQNSIGVAISEDNGLTYRKMFKGPILGVDKYDPYFTGTFFVYKENTNFIGYYLSCVGWKNILGIEEPFYNIKIAVSDDGLEWNKTGKVAIPLQKGEGGIASASVIKENGIYKMWYSVRGDSDYRRNKKNSYRIAYAESKDGFKWKREFSDIIKISNKGWDSEMVAYPYVFKNGNKLFMLYNGNEFGKTGFGYAVLK